MADVTRRSLLAKGMLGSVLLAGGGLVALWTRGTQLVAPKGELLALSPVEFSIIAALAERLIAASGEFPSPAEIRVAEKVDQTIAKMHPENQAELKQGIALFESALGGFLFDRRITPFTQLDAAAQDAVITAWRDSGVALRRSLYMVLKAIIVGAYYASPEVYPALGYPGPPEILPG